MIRWIMCAPSGMHASMDEPPNKFMTQLRRHGLSGL